MNVGDLSILTKMEGYDQECSTSEFTRHLKVDLSSKKCKYGWVFWRSERFEKSDHELGRFGLPASSSFSEREIKDKIKCLLEEIASHSWSGPFLVQFWEPELVGRHVYLSASDHAFSVGLLCKGLCWYRQRCVGHRYRVDEGAAKEELGAVGRVYRNKRPESTPDLRLYSTKEFPLRNDVACYGVRNYWALPVFDLPKERCYGVIEVLCFDAIDMNTLYLEQGLKAAQLRTTHLKFNFSNYAEFRHARNEITRMLELAFSVMPQLQVAEVWVPCRECSNLSNNLSCMKREAFIDAGNKIVNSSFTDDYDIYNFHLACQLHSLQIGKSINMIAAVMSSNNKSCICRNICNFSISENPLAHYAHKARLSFCFAICLQSMQNSGDFYVVEFFLQCREDAFAASFLPLLLRIMEIELRSFEFPYKGQHGEELVVEVIEENMLSSDDSSQSSALRCESIKYISPGESCQSSALSYGSINYISSGESKQSSALRYKSIKYKRQLSEELGMLMVMKGCKKRYPPLDFTNYLQKADLHCLQPSKKSMHGWAFWSQAREEFFENEVTSNSLLLSGPIQEKIKCLMSEIASKWNWDSYALAQFWAPNMHVDRCCLETLGQPFALGCLHRGLAFFRKHCMEHYYFLDERAKEEELGPPGRAFLNGHPEKTPDLRLYSRSEFPLRNHAAHYGLRKYFALPVFALDQHKCVGVLELVNFSDYTLEVIGNALKAANLSSNHISFKPCFQGMHLTNNDAECRQLALTEIRDACQLFTEIPQLYMVEVWVPNQKCPSINNNLSCMQRVWATEQELDLSMCQVQHVEIGRGIAGVTLASENKSCFCRSLCEFSISEQPLSHYAQRARLNSCFAICLQSWHTGDLLYILEFYLNQGPGKYEYLRSFLCLLLPIMKQKLNSFKVASGQQLGEKLVAEVIEFPEMNELASAEQLGENSVVEVIEFPEMNELAIVEPLDVLPITFNFVNYSSKKHFKDRQVQSAPDTMESVRMVAKAGHSSTSADTLEKKNTAPETKEVKGETRLNISLKHLESHFGKKRKDAAEALGISLSTLKRRYREYGIRRWPQNDNHRKNPSLFMRESGNESTRDSQQNMCLSSSTILPTSDVPLHQNVPHTNPESSQRLIVQPTVDTVAIKAKYGDNTIKFQLHNSAGIKKLAEEVSLRLNLRTGSFKMKYLDADNDEVLLACDDDLQQCLNSLAAMGGTCIQMFVQLIGNKLFE